VLHVFVLGGFGQLPTFSDLELPEQRRNEGGKNNKPTFGLFDVKYILCEETKEADHDSHRLDETDDIVIDASLGGHPPIEHGNGLVESDLVMVVDVLLLIYHKSKRRSSEVNGTKKGWHRKSSASQLHLAAVEEICSWVFGR
jgi:hypothetical protein